MYCFQPKWGSVGGGGMAILKTQNENPWQSLTKSCPIKVAIVQLAIIETK